MSSLNRVILIGNLGRDPESRSAGSANVVQFSLATSETWKKDGEQQSRTTWHNIVIWNEKVGDIATRFLRKGSKVYLEGQIQVREYEKDGQKRSVTEIVLPKFGGTLLLLDSRSDAQSPEPRQASKPAHKPSNTPAGDAELDSDIPF